MARTAVAVLVTASVDQNQTPNLEKRETPKDTQLKDHFYSHKPISRVLREQNKLKLHRLMAQSRTRALKESVDFLFPVSAQHRSV